MTGTPAHFDSHIQSLAHHPTRTFHVLSHVTIMYISEHSHISTLAQSLAHHPARTFHVHSHIMTTPLAHFDLHITNHSHITLHIPCSLAHYDRNTRTFRPRIHFDSHITNHSHITLLAHSTFSRMLRMDHSYISTRIAHNQSLAYHSTRTFHVHLHIMTGPLAHHPTRTFHVHSRIMTGPLAHFDLHITNHSHITRTVDQTSTRTFRCCKNQTTRTVTKQVLAHSGVIKTRPLAH